MLGRPISPRLPPPVAWRPWRLSEEARREIEEMEAQNLRNVMALMASGFIMTGRPVHEQGALAE